MLKHILTIAVWFCLSASVMAFEQISEEELSEASAQDGVSVLWKMDDKGVLIDSIALIDKIVAAIG